MVTQTTAMHLWDAMTPTDRIEFLAPFYALDYRLNPRIFDKIAARNFSEHGEVDAKRITAHFEAREQEGKLFNK